MACSSLSVDPVRHDWTLSEARSLFDQPFNDLIFKAQTLHRRFLIRMRFRFRAC